MLDAAASATRALQWRNLANARRDTAPNPVQVENQRPGTPGWAVLQPSRAGEIQAYAGADSINRGQEVQLHVSSNSPYLIQLYRLGYYGGVGARLMATTLGGFPVDQGAYVYDLNRGEPVDCPSCITSLKDEKGLETHIRDANWSVTDTVRFPAQWISGIYLFKLTNSSGKQWFVPLVVRDDSARADLVFQVPLNTDQAYNSWGGTSLYKDFQRAPNGALEPAPRAYYVSWNRPYEQNSGSGNVLVWTYAMLRFLEEQGYNVTYTTNNAVATGATNLFNYKGFVSGGHDEYWSQAERKKLEDAINRGVSAAFFGGNDMYRQVRSYPDLQGRPDRFTAGYDNPPLDPVHALGPLGVPLATGKWRDPFINYPEARILVSMYNAINYHNQDFIVRNTGHWVFTGTGLHDGNAIAGILGYEVDGIVGPPHLPVGDERITIIGQSPFVTADRVPTTRLSVAALRELAATHNIVFNAGTLGWVFGLTDTHLLYAPVHPTDADGDAPQQADPPTVAAPIPVSPALRQMTNNILQRIVLGVVPTPGH